MSGHSTEDRVAVVLDARRRRTRAEKEAILAELQAPGTTVSGVARRHNVAPGLVFRWRRDLTGQTGKTAAGAAGFMPVVLAAGAGKAVPRSGLGIMEIELNGGVRIRIDGSVDAAALRRVIAALEHR